MCLGLPRQRNYRQGAAHQSSLSGHAFEACPKPSGVNHNQTAPD